MDTTTKKAVTILTQADIPCVLWGLPGVGKTAWVSELTHFLGMNENPPMLTADCEPSLIMGIMYPAEDNKSLVRLAPEWAIKSSKEPNHLWFFDEISNADGATQATLLTAIQDRIVAGVKLHPTTRFIFAANPPEISPNGNNMSPPLANRLCHIQWDLSEQMVLDHLKSKYIQGYNKKFNDDEWQVKLPENWQSFLPKAAQLILGFFERKTSLIHNMPKNRKKMSEPWSSPRTIESAIRAYGAMLSVNANMDTIAIAMKGLLGAGVATELMAFLRENDLPEPKEVLNNFNLFPTDQLKTDIATTILDSCMNLLGEAKKKERQEIWEKIQGLFIHASKSGFRATSASKAVDLVKLGIKYDLMPTIEFRDEFMEILETAKVI